jgi:signal transduction histidine kinase
MIADNNFDGPKDFPLNGSSELRPIAALQAVSTSVGPAPVAADPDLQRLRTENDELRRQLMQAQKMSAVGSLAASITHEFNNILTTVINYAKMGIRHKDVGTREKAFDKILAAGQRASKITTGMLSYARSHGERREVTDLIELVEDVVMLIEKDLQMHRVRLQTDFIGRPHSIVNANQLQQVVLNLLVNARQAMENGGILHLGVRANAETGMAEISVRDTGCGIPTEKLREVFEPFYTTKQADRQGQGGTGLGLSLCREIVEAHKGRIRVESAVGKGTTFTLKFALADAPKPIAE